MTSVLIYAGGTIGCTGTPLAPMPAEAFQALWQRHVGADLDGPEQPDWRWMDPALDSSTMTPADWAKVAHLVFEAAADGATGIVILHGTDTLAWTAAALSMVTVLIGAKGPPAARLALPIVLTGSQQPLFHAGGLKPGSDAPDNLRQALRAAAAGHDGVRIAFGGHLIQGARAAKIATTDFEAFTAPNGDGPIAPLRPASVRALADQLGELQPYLGRRYVLNLALPPNDPKLIAEALEGAVAALGPRLGAIHLQGYGIGNVPAATDIAPILTQVRDSGTLLTVGTQVWRGAVDPGAYDAGHWLGAIGALPVRDMTTAAVTAKLHIALALGEARGWDRSAMERFFLTPLAGEIG